MVLRIEALPALLAENVAELVDKIVVGKRESQVGITVKVVAEHQQDILIEYVVAIEADDIFALGQTEREVAHRREPDPVLAMQRYPRVAAIKVHHLRCLVGGSIIDHDQFPVVDGLPQHAFDRFAEEAAVIVRGM